MNVCFDYSKVTGQLYCCVLSVVESMEEYVNEVLSAVPADNPSRSAV